MDLTRNYLFIEPELQLKVNACKVLIIGVGLGSVIAEALVRMGVGKITICDGDVVSASNLNRQNYTTKSINQSKAEALSARLAEINPEIDLQVVSHFVDDSHMAKMIPDHDYVINTIDFDSPAFFACHEICRIFAKPELFPMNLGFGFGLFVFTERYFDSSFSKDTIIHYIISKQNQSSYIKDRLREYNATKREYDPQLYVGALGNAAMVSTVICKILNKEEVKSFPDFYFMDFKSI